MAAMRRDLLTMAIIMLIGTIHAQKIEVTDTAGNIYVGKKLSEDSSRLCILTKNKQTICFNQSLDYYKPYYPYNRALPLTKANDLYIIAHDIGFVYRTGYPDAGLSYALTFQKRFTDHLSAGLQGSFGVGGDLSFLESNLRAISTYQFNPMDRYVHNVSLSAGPLKDILYGSEGGFDMNASYTLLMRREWNKSRRLTFSTGLYSAKFNSCLDSNCNETINLRDNLLQLRIAYGWQF
jgi:hypothetical protein